MKTKFLLPIMIGVLAFSCEKKEEDPTPSPLSKTSAVAELNNTSLTYSSSISSYSAATTSTTSALNSLSSLSSSSSSNIESSLFPSFQSIGSTGGLSRLSLSSQSSEQKLALMLASLANTQKVQASNGRISSSKYEKGIYEYTIEASSSSVDGSQYCYLNKKYYKRYFKFTPTPNSDVIVIKYPSLSSYYQYCDTLAPVNNAIYTVSKIEEKTFTVQECGTTTSEVMVTKLESKLEISGVVAMTYSYSGDTDGNTFYKQNGTMTLGDFKYTFEIGFVNNDVSYKLNWEGKSGKIYGYEMNVSYINFDAISDCDNKENSSETFFGENIKKQTMKYYMGKLVLQAVSENSSYINEIKSKYSITNRKQLNTDEIVNKLNGDTVLYNKYHKNEIFTSNGAKVADIKFLKENSGIFGWTPYLVYNDGSNEKLSDKFVYGLGVMIRYNYFYRYYGN